MTKKSQHAHVRAVNVAPRVHDVAPRVHDLQTAIAAAEAMRVDVKAFAFAMGEHADRLRDAYAVLGALVLACRQTNLMIGAGPAVEKPASRALEGLRRRLGPIADSFADWEESFSERPHDRLTEVELEQLGGVRDELLELVAVLAVYVAAFENERIGYMDPTRVLDVVEREVQRAHDTLDTFLAKVEGRTVQRVAEVSR